MNYKICYEEIPLKVYTDGNKIYKIEFLKTCKENNIDFLAEFLKLLKEGRSVFFIDFEKIDPSIRLILETVYKIPYGTVTTYGEISKKVFNTNDYARFVGSALSKNPIPVLIPCHRVIDRNLRLHGFSGGLTLKEKLLKAEGIEIKNGKVDKRFLINL
ncbi:MGMT family protein [Caldisericum exile]|uniref:Methylated-DNA--protein-cysteine methyltransferase n=1 Tax=Caldisericum exile (strain DSM 21853 / NBRC 104410 / AZM16c01) TaxID=511051 RepID=A0A7U6JFT5_CALEA|nr:MGMT family protein [Caldisericum exile]BAL80585.1 methylated-DNA--protein-cysteine methyltransferase [Caldisericum exile AZM16c01]